MPSQTNTEPQFVTWPQLVGGDNDGRRVPEMPESIGQHMRMPTWEGDKFDGEMYRREKIGFSGSTLVVIAWISDKLTTDQAGHRIWTTMVHAGIKEAAMQAQPIEGR